MNDKKSDCKGYYTEEGKRKMIIFITDEGRYWNHHNPILEKYADCIVVVCLNGKKVTDKYKCIVSPYKYEDELGLMDYRVSNQKYQALQSIYEELRCACSHCEDIVFLTDAEPQSLYPYLVLKDDEKYNKGYNKMHLWCMSPWKFEGERRKTIYKELEKDIDKLTSLHYVDGNKFLEQLDGNLTIIEAMSKCQEWLNAMFPGALYEIENEMNVSGRYYYDLDKKRYVSTKDSYFKALKTKAIKEEAAKKEPSKKKIGKKELAKRKSEEKSMSTQKDSDVRKRKTFGYPNSGKMVKAMVEQLHPRLEGKEICMQLKKMRQALADENGIKFQTVECPSTAPCAGTCEYCDMEITYLAEQLAQIKEEERKYPKYEIR